MKKTDIKGILFLVKYIKEERYSTVTKFTKTHSRDIHERIIDLDKSLSISTIDRVMRFEINPTNISYDSLDDLVQWAFESVYFNFSDFLEKNEEQIDKEIELSETELENIIERVHSKDTTISLSNKPQKINIGGAALQIDLSEGFVSKLLDNIKPIVGDLVSSSLKKEKKELTYHTNPSINIRLAIKEELRQKNIDSIVKKALSFSRERESSDEPVDPDWMSFFFESAQDTSNENMQYIWAKILSNEVDMPESFSRRSLSAIKLIDPDEAKIFTLLSSCLWGFLPEDTMFERVLFKNYTVEGNYSDLTWGFNSDLLKHLEDIGLVHETSLLLEQGEVYNISYSDKTHQLCSNESTREIEVIRLSTIGAEIYDVVMTEPNNEYYKYALSFFKANNILKE